MSSKSSYVQKISDMSILYPIYTRTYNIWTDHIVIMISLQSYYVDFCDMHDKCLQYGKKVCSRDTRSGGGVASGSLFFSERAIWNMVAW